MATIAVTRLGARLQIALDGRVTARDLKRLERACHDALQQKDLPLELKLDGVSFIDGAAQAFIERLRIRGARISGPGAPAAAVPEATHDGTEF